MKVDTADISARLVGMLGSSVGGRVITPQQPEYEEARSVANAAIDRRPALVVRAVDAVDVAAVVGLASETGLELAVRSGGHGNAGHGTTDGGIVLDLGAMKGLEIDVAGRTAWAESGLTAGETTIALGAHGLAVGFGDTATVGIGGITLGGGIGYLSRRFGLTIDSLLAADVVTADGRLVRVDAENHPDLFWAIRGGGGNFGVATRFKFRLQPVDTIYGGLLVLPATARVIASFMALAESAPDELSSIVNVMTAPPMPFLPPEVHGQVVVLSMLAYSGPLADAERAVAPFRAIATPLADMVRPMKYPEMYPPEDRSYRPTALTRGLFLDHVDTEVARTILERLQASDAALRVAQLRFMGGAIARVSNDATAYAHRRSRIVASLTTVYEGPDDRPVREDWMTGFAAALQQSDRGAYVNFLGDEGPERIHAAYPGRTWDRLAEVKARYDPDNLFRLNQNVPPALPVRR